MTGNYKRLAEPLAACIFDMDGTLLDSMDEWRSVSKTYLASVGITAPPDIREHVRSLSLAESAELFRREFGIDKTVQQIMDGMDEVIASAYSDRVLLKPGAAELLRRLAARGTRLCIATATNIRHVEVALTRLGIRNYFEFIATCTNIGLPKSDPRFFELVLERLGVEKQSTVVFEDALYAVRSAKAAGFFVAGVYDPADPGDDIEPFCDAYATELGEYAELLK